MAEKDVKDFEALRVTLQKELKKAKLKRELDRVDARNDAALARVQSEYKAKEKALYLRLLAAMYKHEERIFQDRLAAAEDAAAIRKLDFQADQVKATEALDDEWAFQERTLSAKIAELSAGLAKGAEEPEELKAAKAERTAKETAYRNGVAALNEKQRTFDDRREEGPGGRDRGREGRPGADPARLPPDRHAVPQHRGRRGHAQRRLAGEVRLRGRAAADVGYREPQLRRGQPPGPQREDDRAARRPPARHLELVGGCRRGVRVRGHRLRPDRLQHQPARGRPAGRSPGDSACTSPAGFSSYAVDYAFKPLPDYGFQHGIGVTISF